MDNYILPYPSLNDDLRSKVRFQKQQCCFFYTDAEDEEHELACEQLDSSVSVYCIKDENGQWTQDDNNLCFRRKYCLRTFQCLFGSEGIACKNSKLGLAIQWTSPDSKQRGVINVGIFGSNDQILEAEAEKHFAKAQLRGNVDFSTILYLAVPGNPDEDEIQFANENGYVLGELDHFSIRLDGSSSSLPVFEVNEPDQPLWYIKCDWLDPTTDSLSECVSINLNTAHKNYIYVDRSKKNFDNQLLIEIMSSAVCLLIEKVRQEAAYWDQILQGDSLETGSIGQAIYYFSSTLEWDLTTPDTTSLSARKYFEQRIS